MANANKGNLGDKQTGKDFDRSGSKAQIRDEQIKGQMPNDEELVGQDYDSEAEGQQDLGDINKGQIGKGSDLGKGQQQGGKPQSQGQVGRDWDSEADEDLDRERDVEISSDVEQDKPTPKSEL